MLADACRDFSVAEATRGKPCYIFYPYANATYLFGAWHGGRQGVAAFADGHASIEHPAKLRNDNLMFYADPVTSASITL